MCQKLPPYAQWLLLLLVTIVVTYTLYTVGLPGSLLLGPMVSGILLALNGATILTPKPTTNIAQGIVGAMMAGAVTPDIFKTFLTEWPLFLGAILSIIMASGTVGWLMSRWKVLPGTSAIWGSSPGAASAMVIMAEEFGADVRVVAFMQYLRVLCVASSAAIIAHFTEAHAPLADHQWLALPPTSSMVQTLALIVGGMVLGIYGRIPNGAFLVPLGGGAILRAFGLIDIAIPQPILLLSYACIGWMVGLRFTHEILILVARKLPHMLASIGCLMLYCAGIALGLTLILDIDLLTAYLATSPGSADGIAIIAASTNADLGFVLAFQTVRLIIVQTTGPFIARYLASRS